MNSIRGETVAVNFVSQSTLRAALGRSAAQPIRGRCARTTAGWLRYFESNLAKSRLIPWERGAEATPAELDAIGRSLQAWQLGEASDGGHLRVAAARYAARVGDADYPAVVELFIREEQRHGEMLGGFLDLAGVGRVTANWGDSLFRSFRYCLPNLE